MLWCFFLTLQNNWSNSLVILAFFFGTTLLWEFSFGRENGAKKEEEEKEKADTVPCIKLKLISVRL